MAKYEINAEVTMYVDADSLREAETIADCDLGWVNGVENVRITQSFEFGEDQEDEDE